ncbi:hypothetical protein N7456_002665 [Penicillium angulare]|uniref:Uncharacterized protein n=1 Tax=Penicillium angulare TaxID=116970 RepID=A0A9W9G8M7_9EURO|nr:hypothetical protein N7456_002665 [Penicillium angulare]
MQQDGTLAACMALSLCEAIDCPTAGSEGYFNHCHGFISLVQARGTRAHSAGAGHQLFLAIRVPSILYSLRSNSSTFLLDPIWMEEPWTETSKSLIHQVTDCLAEAPQILQRVSLLAHLDPTQQLQLIYELVQEAWKTDQKLKIIHDEVYHTTTDTMYCTVSSLINPLAERSNTSNLFPNSFHFANIEIGATLTLLWATRTILWSGLCNLYDFHDRVNAFMKMINTTEDSSFTPVSKNGNGSSDPLPPLGYCENYLDMAHNVCQSLQFFLQGDMGLVGIFSVSPAIGIVISSLQNRLGHDLEVSWLKAGLNLLREKSGAVSKI